MGCPLRPYSRWPLTNTVSTPPAGTLTHFTQKRESSVSTSYACGFTIQRIAWHSDRASEAQRSGNDWMWNNPFVFHPMFLPIPRLVVPECECRIPFALPIVGG